MSEREINNDKQMCDNCGCEPTSGGQFIQRGMFIGCWVCSKKCKKELLSCCMLPDESRAEARQMGLTAL